MIINLTAEAIEAALDEFDQMGREEFLTKYSYGKSDAYWVLSRGKAYDAKAIAGGAHGNLPDLKALSHAEYSGGTGIAAKLTSLGYVLVVPQPIASLPKLGVTIPPIEGVASQPFRRVAKAARFQIGEDFKKNSAARRPRQLAFESTLRAIAAETNNLEIPVAFQAKNGAFQLDFGSIGYAIAAGVIEAPPPREVLRVVRLTQSDAASLVTPNLRFAVIVENDETQWHDEPGIRYHIPKRYARLLPPGTRLLHYKGRLIDRQFADRRLSSDPHYLGTSVAGQLTPDPESAKGDLYLSLREYAPFKVAVDAAKGGAYFEEVPKERTNYWRDGVRAISQGVFDSIVAAAEVSQVRSDGSSPAGDDLLTSVIVEGNTIKVYTTKYERSPENRRKAIAIHGTACFACEQEMGALYGSEAAGFIHVHHLRPVSRGPSTVDPRTDLLPLCPNCHSIVHFGGKLKTVNQVRALLGKTPRALCD